MTVDTVNKSPIVSEVLLEEVLKLRPRHLVFGLGTTFMLVPLLHHRSMEKQSSEKDLIGPDGPSSFEVTFTLLTKTVTIQV